MQSVWIMNEPAKKITREEFYQRVWSTPFVRLGKELSDRREARPEVQAEAGHDAGGDREDGGGDGVDGTGPGTVEVAYGDNMLAVHSRVAVTWRLETTLRAARHPSLQRPRGTQPRRKPYRPAGVRTARRQRLDGQFSIVVAPPPLVGVLTNEVHAEPS